MAIETYFKNIADAIRTRGGYSSLITPAGMPSAIENIPGGGATFEQPYIVDLNNGYVAGSKYYISSAYPNIYSDVYKINLNDRYLLLLDDVVSNRFRVMDCNTDPITAQSDIQGTTVFLMDNPDPYIGVYFKANGSYLIVTKTTTAANVNTYLLNITNLLEGV